MATTAQTFEIVVPPGVAPGGAFKFLAAGKTFQTQCPAGAGPGYKVRVTLQLPAAQGPLKQAVTMQAEVRSGVNAATALENEARAYFTQYDVNKARAQTPSHPSTPFLLLYAHTDVSRVASASPPTPPEWDDRDRRAQQHLRCPPHPCG